MFGRLDKICSKIENAYLVSISSMVGRKQQSERKI